MKHECATVIWQILLLVLLWLSGLGAAIGQMDAHLQPNQKWTLPQLVFASSEHFTDIESADLTGLLQRIGDARLVLLGESTHGTAEFYDLRARITRQLIQNKGFTLIAVEANWPDAIKIDAQINADPRNPADSVSPFTGFPAWMWSNRSMARWLQWLADYNRSIDTTKDGVSFYGLDLYNLYGSIQHLLDYVATFDPALGRLVRSNYGCLQPWVRDPFTYSDAMQTGKIRDCGYEVTTVLRHMQNLDSPPDAKAERSRFRALQSARLVRDGENYYRNLNIERSSWNRRDRSMFETLLKILDFHGPDAKIVIWAHNSHVGDARATAMTAQGDLNLGQLVREHFGKQAYLIGLGTDRGTVAAAAEWGGPMQVMPLPSAPRNSYEGLFSAVAADNFLLPLRNPILGQTPRRLLAKRMQRAIGVVYDPAADRQRNYAPVSLPRQFDEYIWFRTTRAVQPLL